MELAPRLVLLRYDDVPGVIGRVGTLLRRGGREHREHGGLAEPRGRQGADGAVDRLARRRPSCSSSCSEGIDEAYSDSARQDGPGRNPSSVSAVLRAAARRGSRRGVHGRHADRARRRRGGRLRACRRSSSRIVLVCDGAYRARARPGRPPRRRARGRRGHSAHERCGSPTPTRSSRRPGFEPGRSRAVPAARRHADADGPRAASHHGVVWIGAGTERHMASLAAERAARLAGARTVDARAARVEFAAPEPRRSRRCRRPRRSG